VSRKSRNNTIIEQEFEATDDLELWLRADCRGARGYGNKVTRWAQEVLSLRKGELKRKPLRRRRLLSLHFSHRLRPFLRPTIPSDTATTGIVGASPLVVIFIVPTPTVVTTTSGQPLDLSSLVLHPRTFSNNALPSGQIGTVVRGRDKRLAPRFHRDGFQGHSRSLPICEKPVQHYQQRPRGTERAGLDVQSFEVWAWGLALRRTGK